jgi:hypothetical protein
VEQTITQIATQLAGLGGNINQAITQLAQQIASNPNGAVTQKITQIAQQFAAGNSNCANQAINQVAAQTAQGNNIVQVITQIAILTSCPTPAPNTATLIVVKNVINDDGGRLRPSDFQISVLGPSELSPNPESFPGRSGSGTTVEVTANTPFRVTETTSSRYNSDFDECRTSRGIPPDGVRLCTITNNDKDRTDTSTSSIIEYRETTPIAIDIETLKFDKGVFGRSEIIPIADVSPYVMVGGHVLLNLPTGDFRLIVAETSSDEVEHAILLSPQRVGSVRAGQSLYHVDLDDKMSGKNPFTNRADKVTEWMDLLLWNSDKKNGLAMVDDNQVSVTIVADR